MGLSESLVLFVGSDDVLEIPKRVEPKPVATKPVTERKSPRKGCVVRCSADTHDLLNSFASEYGVSIGRVVDELAYRLTADQTTFRAVIAALDE